MTNRSNSIEPFSLPTFAGEAAFLIILVATMGVANAQGTSFGSPMKPTAIAIEKPPVVTVTTGDDRLPQPVKSQERQKPVAQVKRQREPLPENQKPVAQANKQRVGATTEHRVALVIGNGKYDRAQSLPNAVNDARAMSALLKKDLNFEVIELIDANKVAMEQAIRDFVGRLGEKSAGLLYYAGHAMQISDRNYLLPVDAVVAKGSDFRGNAIDVGSILKQMGATKSPVKIVILDACRDDPFRLGKSGEFLQGLSPVASPSGTLVAFATSPGNTASDGDGANGVYTGALLNVLAKPGLLAEEAFREVRQQVLKQTKNTQIPWETTSLERPWYFRPPAKLDERKIAFRKIFRDCEENCPDLIEIPKGVLPTGNGSKVSVSHFAIGKFEITFDEWDACVAAKGCSHVPLDQGWGRGRRPVIDISWQDAMEYVDWLARKTNKRYRLPTEVEWQYAADAGTGTPYFWGKDAVKDYANCFGCSSSDPKRWTLPVGSFPPNPWGLHDTAGNVAEWVASCWTSEFPPPKGADAMLQSIPGCGVRVARGGSFETVPHNITATYRDVAVPKKRSRTLGFRIARDL